MLLLPTTLSALSVAIGAAMIPAPALEDAALPAAALVADTAYLTDVRATEPAAGPGLPYLSELLATDGYLLPPGSDAIAAQEDDGDDGFGAAAGQDRLDGMRGGDGSTSGTIVMNGTVADNRATNVITGTNIITEGSFANASGVPTVVQNTGANVLIQNATVINLQLH